MTDGEGGTGHRETKTRFSVRRRLEGLRTHQAEFKGNRKHLDRLLDTVLGHDEDQWNRWRKAHPRVVPDLRRANLAGANLDRYDLRRALLFRANLSGATLWQSNFAAADLRQANLQQAQLNYADLRHALLDRARLVLADLTMVDARDAQLRGADLSYANLGGANLCGVDLRGSHIAGINAWQLEIDERTRQEDMRVDIWVDPLEDLIDVGGEAIEQIEVRCDRLEAAHVLHLLCSGEKSKTQTVINALTRRVVLLLGDFGRRGKSVLGALRLKLGALGYAPIVFDFERPDERDMIETVSLIAGFSHFVIADLTRPKSTPLETMLIAPQTMVPFAPIIRRGERPFAMFGALQSKYDWILDTFEYRNTGHLIRALETRIVKPCERLSRALVRRRRRGDLEPRRRSSRRRVKTRGDTGGSTR